MLEIYKIEKSYGNKKVLDGISFAVKRNETVSILGLGGTGKTTLLNIISGQEMPDKGNISLDGINITGKVGFVGKMTQSAILTPNETIENGLQAVAELSMQSENFVDLNVKKELSLFDLSDTADLYPSQISKDIRQRILLLRTYMMGKRVNLLDEPFSGLDVPTKTDIIKWFANLSRSRMSSTILVTHNIDEALALSNRMFLINGVPAQIINEFNIFNSADKSEIKKLVITEFKQTLRHLK
ncbi:MAG: ATP-binding cassette domain-containing protein [Oscillospiraceae bacterium]|nr:ATP-binding cassette domain-containing protein [Oscillospiraceae bacterium]